MNKFYFYNNTPKYIGKDQLITILSPLFTFKKYENYKIDQLNTESYFYNKYNHDIDGFLMNNGYIDCEEAEYNLYPIYRPDIFLFKEHVNDLLGDFPPIDDPNVLKKCATILEQMSDIANMFYKAFGYDEEFRDEINKYKSEYLIDKLHLLFDLNVSMRDNEPHISIDAINDFIINELSQEYERILIELGFPPQSPGIPDTSRFMTYIEDYINKNKYLLDDFHFGEALLRKIDEHIVELDWFPHYNL